MRKILSFIVLLAISSTLSFGQNIKPSTFRLIQNDDNQTLEQYFNKNAVSNAKVTIWYSNMATTTDWVAAKLTSQSANITNTWQWAADTNSFSTNFNNYLGKGVRSLTPTQGIYYFDAISNLIGNNFGITNATLTNAVGISTLGKSAVSIKFYQMYRAFNADSSLLEISTDNINWKTYDVNPTVAVNTTSRGWKEFNISQWAANQAQVWIRFRFFAPALAGTPPASGYSGGYGWAVDDVELIVPADNKIQVNRVTLHDGYTQIPSGLGMPMYYDADIINIGAVAQPNVKLHAVDLTTGTDSISNIDTTLSPMASLTYVNTQTDFFIWNTGYFSTPSTTQGTYKVTSYISTDSIAYLALDTLRFNVVAPTGLYSRDNNTYTSSRWLGASTSGTSDAYTVANRFEVNTNRMAYGANIVVSNDTKPGSKIQAVLYTINSGSGLKVKVAESKNQYIAADKIPTTVPMVNPPSINLAFVAGNPAVPTGFTMEKDTVYLLGLSVYGGTDTVKIATDNTGIPQWEQTSLVFDPSDNTWYKWTSGNVPAQMIRVVFDPTLAINEISNNSATLFSCMPNPANNTTQISYELKNSETTTIFITDLTGRTVKTINQGMQSKGNHSVDINLSDLTSGTYFYTLNTPSAQVTKKLIIVKR